MSLLFVAYLLFGCNSQGSKNGNSPTADSVASSYETTIKEKESVSIETNTDSIGDLISTIAFAVKTDDLKNFEDGLIPWASIEKPQNDLPNLSDRDKVVIQEQKITIVIDYPLTTAYSFSLNSKEGFTRGQLLKAISEHYYKLYAEEEESATIKTQPADERTIMNRNETNGKYGIWGHDIADLVLSEILVYKSKTGDTILMLNIES